MTERSLEESKACGPGKVFHDAGTASAMRVAAGTVGRATVTKEEGRAAGLAARPNWRTLRMIIAGTKAGEER